MSIRALALTAGIFGAASMFFLAWWLILTGNAEGPPTILERIYIGYTFTPVGSVIGAATPMMMSPMGGAQEMPDEVQEKMTSAVSAMVRAAAEQGGHDPQLGEAMVRAEIEYKVGKKIISKSGQLLTLTNTEAEQIIDKKDKRLLSSGTVKDIESLLAVIGLPKAKKNEIEVTGAESIARAIAKIAPILILIGMAIFSIIFYIYFV